MCVSHGSIIADRTIRKPTKDVPKMFCQMEKKGNILTFTYYPNALRGLEMITWLVLGHDPNNVLHKLNNGLHSD